MTLLGVLLSRLARRVDDAAEPSDDTWKSGTPITVEEIAALSEEARDGLADAFLTGLENQLKAKGEDGTIRPVRQMPAALPGERGVARLQRTLKMDLMRFEASSREFVEKMGLKSKTIVDALSNTRRAADILRLQLGTERDKILEAARGPAADIQRLLRGTELPFAALAKEIGKFEELNRLAAPAPQALYREPHIPLKIPPNPIHETNDRLDELSEKFDRLVGLADQQAKVVQSLAETATTVLAHTAAMAEEAQESSRQAGEAAQQTRKGVRIAVIAIIVGAVFSGIGIAISGFAAIDARQNSTGSDVLLERIEKAILGTGEKPNPPRSLTPQPAMQAPLTEAPAGPDAPVGTRDDSGITVDPQDPDAPPSTTGSTGKASGESTGISAPGQVR